MALAVGLFVVALAVIASERVDRTKAALAGAIVMLLTQTIEQERAIEAIDFNTIGLLAGMMLMVRLTEPTGVYAWLAIRAGQISRGRPFAVVLSLSVTTRRPGRRRPARAAPVAAAAGSTRSSRWTSRRSV